MEPRGDSDPGECHFADAQSYVDGALSDEDLEKFVQSFPVERI
jgi:hypothetical protein